MTDTISQRVEGLRSRRGLTRAALAHLIGVSRPTLWAWETGRGQPRDKNIEALAEALAVSAEFLKYGVSLVGDDTAVETAGGGDGNALRSYIADAKTKIATLAGVSVDQVTIRVEY